jgi:hypothetical protein
MKQEVDDVEITNLVVKACLLAGEKMEEQGLK